MIIIYVSCPHFSDYHDLLVWISDDPNFHSLKAGEIFHTDGILTKKRYKTNNTGDFRI